MSKYAAVGVDIGGTKIAFALVNEQGDVLIEERLATHAEFGAERIITRIAAMANSFVARSPVPVVGIGIGCPGHVESDSGIVRLAVHLDWYDVALREGITCQLRENVPVYIDNDVRALAHGESLYGAGKNIDNFVLLALGTGLGSAAVVNGEVVRGGHHFAMEIGHMALIANGRHCTCGREGCLDMYLSGTGIMAAVDEHKPAYPQSQLQNLPYITPHDVICAMKEGDPLAVAIRDEFVYWLTYATGWITGIYDPSRIILGGGLGLALAPQILDEVQRRLSEHTLLPINRQPQIVMAQVIDSAVGAASLALANYQLSAPSKPS